MKLLWSPIVDAIYSRKIGRRKSWIVPIQACSGLLLLWLGSHIEDLLATVCDLHAVSDSRRRTTSCSSPLFSFLWYFYVRHKMLLLMVWLLNMWLIIGWALTLLSTDNLSYASTAQTIGLNTGYFLSFTVFLAFNSPEFANKYFRHTPLDYGLISLGGYLKFWGWMYLIITVWLAKFKKEEQTRTDDGGVKSVYLTIWSIIKLPRTSLSRSR